MPGVVGGVGVGVGGVGVGGAPIESSTFPLHNMSSQDRMMLPLLILFLRA